MSATEVDAVTTEELRPLVADRPGLLLGAGASAAAGLPGWDTLAMRLLTGSGVTPDEPTAKSFLAEQDAMLVAEAARAVVPDWHALIRDALYDGDDEPEPAVLHLAAAALAAGRDPGTVQLHTLNFDPLLGTALRFALEELGLSADVHERAESAQGPPGQHVVNHLHGIVRATPGGEARNVVLTLKDFTELGATAHPWQVAALQDTLQKGPLILAGTSYRDPDIRQWLHGIGRDHEVVVLLARQGLNLDPTRSIESVRRWRSNGAPSMCGPSRYRTTPTPRKPCENCPAWATRATSPHATGPGRYGRNRSTPSLASNRTTAPCSPTTPTGSQCTSAPTAT